MIVDCGLYENGHRHPGTLPFDEVASACHRKDAFVWIGLYEPTEAEFDTVRREFELHELAVEDAIKAHQRPKLEVYDDTILSVLKTARYIDETEDVEIGEIQLFVGSGFIVVVRHGEGSPLAGVRHQVEQRPDLLRCGPAAVAHAIVDKVVDDYGPVLNGIENDIREVEFQVFAAQDFPHVAERIYKLKREVLELHQATVPLGDPLEQLARGWHRVPEDLTEYFRDVHDHLLRTVDRVAAARDLLTSVLEANLTRVNVRQNEDMRKISAWAAIALLPTAVAGIYGMNFDNMPELRWRYGYFVVVGFIAVACFVLHRLFRRNGWL